MEKEEQLNEEQERIDRDSCGVKPTLTGGDGAGSWKCIEGDWKWIENVGG